MTLAAELVGIERRFGRVVALAGADLALRPGEVHGLLGQNGAGKTTLARVLGGLLEPDGGSISIGGTPTRIRGVGHARDLGIGVVHQHFSMVPAFSGLDNVRLFDGGAWRTGGLPVDGYRAMVVEKAAELGLPVVLDEPVEALSVGDRQRLELLKVLMNRIKILILDEPTAVLAPVEIEGLFRVLRRLAQEGAAICLIAHKLNEVLAVADRVTVLRDGASVMSRKAGDVTPDELVDAMMGTAAAAASAPVVAAATGLDTAGERPGYAGRDTAGQGEPPRMGRGGGPAPEASPRPAAMTTHVVAALEDVTVGPDEAPLLSHVSLQVRRGEVVGIAGVEGNGQRALASVLAGVTSPDRGTRTLPERVGWIPQDRSTEGLVGSFSLTENVALAFHEDPAYRRGPWLDWRAMRETTTRIVAELGVRTVDAGSPAMTLSGGNQQKLLTGRELERAPDLLVAESPTRGLDVGAAATVHRRIRSLVEASNPPGVVLISTDLDEILVLADRILVLVRGRLIEVPPAGRTRTGIGERMLSARET